MSEPKKPTRAAPLIALLLLRRRWLTVLLVGVPAVWAVIINLPTAEPEVSVLTSGKTMISNEERPFRAHVVYSPGYLISIGGLEKVHPFDIRKYEKIHRQLMDDGVLTDEQTVKPEPLQRDDLLLVHSEAYLDSLKSRSNIARYLEAPILKWAPVSLDKAVLMPFRRASGGTVAAAKLALQSGVGINIGGGYHHAKPDKGEGFCAYADVAIAIRKLQSENLIERAVVVDVDAHQGNGTAECLADDDATFTFSMHEGGIYPMPKSISDLDVELAAGTTDEQYMKILRSNLERVLDESNAEICFVVAGCDTLATDPLANLQMTPDGVVERDAYIVAACAERRIPVVFTLSGGYSPDAWRTQYRSVKKLIDVYGLANQD